jgi:hypothetical protein
MLKYYVYAYLRNKDSKTAKAGTPYYIGKGSGNRAWKKHKNVKIPKDNFYIVILESNLTELGAFALERRMIRWYGRKDLGTGMLFNKTDGGDGFPGTVYTEERNQKISNSLSGRKKTVEHKLSISKSRIGKPQSSETIQNRVSKLTGKKRTEEFKVAQSERFVGKPKPWLVGREGANKGRKWWNNGTSSKLSLECPGNGWIEGRIL